MRLLTVLDNHRTSRGLSCGDAFLDLLRQRAPRGATTL
jgi:hypothetical protein